MIVSASNLSSSQSARAGQCPADVLPAELRGLDWQQHFGDHGICLGADIRKFDCRELAREETGMAFFFKIKHKVNDVKKQNKLDKLSLFKIPGIGVLLKLDKETYRKIDK